MILRRTVDPVTEPVSLIEAKTHCRVDIDEDDTHFTNVLIPAARRYVESVSRRSFITQTWRLSLDDWPHGDEIQLPRPPLVSVSSVVYKDQDGNSTTWASSNYIVDTDSEPGRVKLTYNNTWPSETLYPALPVQITYVAGYGDADDVPEEYKQAILLLIGHWYENREAIGTVGQPIALAVESLIWVDRVF